MAGSVNIHGMLPILYFLLFPVFLYFLIGFNFAVVLCLFAPRFLSEDLQAPGLGGRLAAFPMVLVAWPKYAGRMIQSSEP